MPYFKQKGGDYDTFGLDLLIILLPSLKEILTRKKEGLV